MLHVAKANSLFSSLRCLDEKQHSYQYNISPQNNHFAEGSVNN